MIPMYHPPRDMEKNTASALWALKTSETEAEARLESSPLGWTGDEMGETGKRDREMDEKGEREKTLPPRRTGKEKVNARPNGELLSTSELLTNHFRSCERNSLRPREMAKPYALWSIL